MTTATGAICTTLNAIWAHEPCADSWAKLLAYLGKRCADDEPLPLTTILDSNGLTDVLWALRAVTGEDRRMRLFAVWCARQVQHLMTDQRSLAALDVAERHANGLATDEELAAARVAAGDAAHAWRYAAGYAAKAAARVATYDAAEAATVAARVAAVAAGSEVRAAARTAPAAAWSKAWTAAQAAQAAEFRRVFGGDA